MNKRIVIVFLTTLMLACTGQAQDSSESASNAGHPSIFIWDIDVSVDCASSTGSARCVQDGDRFIAVDRDGSEPFSDVLILIREKDSLRHAYQASVSLIMDSGAIHQIKVDFLDHVGHESNPIQKLFTVSNLPGDAGNENELKACLDRLSELDSRNSIGYNRGVEGCSRESSVHWRIQSKTSQAETSQAETSQAETSESQLAFLGPPDDGQGTGTGGN